MAQLTGAANEAIPSLSRNAVRPSWSYEIVLAEEQRDAGEVVASNILATRRRRKLSKRLNEAASAAHEQIPQTAVTTDVDMAQMNSVHTPHAIIGRLPAARAGDGDVVFTMQEKERDPEIGGSNGQAAGALFNGSVRDQQLQSAFPPVDLPQGPQIYTSSITQTADTVSHGRAWESSGPKSPTGPVPRQTQDVNSKLEGSFGDNNHVTALDSDVLLLTNTTLASCPHGFENLLNGPTIAGLSESTRTPCAEKWTLKNVLVSSSTLNSSHSIQHVRDAKDICGEIASRSINVPVPNRSILNNEPTPLLLDNNVSTYYQFSVKIELGSIEIERLNRSDLDKSTSDSRKRPNTFRSSQK